MPCDPGSKHLFFLYQQGGDAMKAQHLMVGSALLILTGCQHMGMGGDGMPTLTRTGEVKDIVIREELTPATVSANPGDEIRWINKRQGNVRVVFLDPVTESLSCRRNFGGLMGENRHQYTANLGSNDSASLCFKNPSQVRYVVRAESHVGSGEENIPGSINIGGGSSSVQQQQRERTGEAARMDEPGMSPPQ
jgi:plastocyanin